MIFYGSLSVLILKSYDLIIKIMEKNPKEFNEIDYDFETYMSELIDSIMYNWYNIDIIDIDRNEMLKQLKHIDKKDIIEDIINMIKKNNDNDEDDD